jgi:hypothetical protein
MRNGIKINSDFKGVDRNGNHIHVSGTTKERFLKMKLLQAPSKLIDFLL